MLRLVDICKDYVSKDQPVVHALNNVSISFRKNEFVSVLGPSGCGKTTLLNIIGGLDKYTTGDLVIVGKSTKQFSDRDWDHYRNLRIGFIFQSYNLIPHQTVLQNVELALTISGISVKERRRRAKQALDEVGLKGMYNKKPNQLSGGQCQRVAIARALVNKPEILLADEPTGALDTKTSTQIMDLIKEIAKDRLVIMVTHNPDIANEYSTRIINLKDGKVISDTNPYSEEEEKQEVELLDHHTKNKTSKAKMSLWQAFKLSGTNLLSKLNRTLLVAFACSIGIIGVSSVLAVSCGVNDYIVSMQDDMLSSYPVELAERAVDYTSLITGLTTSTDTKVKDFDVTTKVGMDSMIAYLMDKYTDITNVKTNTITPTLLSYIEQLEDTDALAALSYNYGIDTTNNVFCGWKRGDNSTKEYISLNGLTQKYIASLSTVPGFSEYSRYVSLFTNFMKQLPGEEEYILSQYDLLGDSTFPVDRSEMLIVVDSDTTLTDLTLAQMGYYTQDQFMNIARKVIKDNEDKKLYNNNEISYEEYQARLAQNILDYPYQRTFEYEDIIGSEFYYFPQKNLYEYSEVTSYTQTVMSCVFLDMSGLAYLTYDINSDRITGISYNGSNYASISLDRIGPTPNATGIEMMVGEWEGTHYVEITTPNEQGRFTGKYGANKESATNRTGTLSSREEDVKIKGFNYQAEATDDMIANPTNYGGFKMKVSGLLRPKATTRFGCLSRGVYYRKDFASKYMDDNQDPTNAIIFDESNGFNAYLGSTEEGSSSFKAYVKFHYTDFSNDGDVGEERDDGYANALNSSSGLSLSTLITISGLINYFEQDRASYRVLTGYKIIAPETEEDDYEFQRIPESIEFYPTSFEAKNVVTDHLLKWNENIDLIIDGEVVPKSIREDITYTDQVAMIITVINTLITIITTALVIFTSLSLVVSSFMIAIITVISVMERIKEIGVIRSLGGRKKDVSRLFIMENLITGLSSGLFGIIITYLLSLILNISVSFFGVPMIAALPWWLALVMISISIALNVLSGLVPSLGSAHKNPVEALRSE